MWAVRFAVRCIMVQPATLGKARHVTERIVLLGGQQLVTSDQGEMVTEVIVLCEVDLRCHHGMAFVEVTWKELVHH